MPTMDEILDGISQDIGRIRMLVPEQLLDQWRLNPRELGKLFLLFEQHLDGAGLRLHAITQDLIYGKLPTVMHEAWMEALENGWVDGEIPPFRFERDPYNTTRIGLMWEGRMVAVNYSVDG